MSSRGRGYRHGVHKNLAEGLGGLLAGAALVLLLRSLARKRVKTRATPAATDTEAGPATP